VVKNYEYAWIVHAYLKCNSTEDASQLQSKHFAISEIGDSCHTDIMFCKIKLKM
jgi:hypothetical protein